jgi:hypothetical protein
MNKSTKAISLVLMGSALALAGCSSRTDDEQDDRVGNSSGHGVYTSGRPIGTGFRGGAAVGSGASARRGFGGTGGIGGGS